MSPSSSCLAPAQQWESKPTSRSSGGCRPPTTRWQPWRRRREPLAAPRPSNFPSAPPKDTPLRTGGPIKHVFFIVRENRNYDQVLGDLGRGDGDPQLTIFGRQITPNMHALANRFGVLDRAFADAEVSI